MCAPAILGLGGALSSMSTATMFAVSLGTSALTAGAQYMSQAAAAEAQAEAQAANIKATTDAATKNYVLQQGDLHARESELKASTALRLDNQRKAASRAKATATASSESAGLSFDALTADFDRQYSEYAAAEFQQLGYDLDQIERTRQGVEAQAQSRINSVPRTPIQQPSFLTAAASFGGDALGAYDKYTVRDPITGRRTF